MEQQEVVLSCDVSLKLRIEMCSNKHQRKLPKVTEQETRCAARAEQTSFYSFPNYFSAQTTC